MELAKLKPNPTLRFEVVHPDPEENPSGFWITLAGMDSPAVKAAQDKVTDKRLAALRKGAQKPLTTAEVEAQALAVLTAAVVAWEGLTEDGEDVPCTPENVRALLTEHTWVRRQVDEALGNDALFFGA